MKETRHAWTEHEVELLREAYKTWPPAYDLLPEHHTRGSVHTKAHKLGLTRRRSIGASYGHISDTEWAYLAGLLDGEGNIHVSRLSRQGARNGNRTVAITNTDVAVIEWLREKFPGSALYTQWADPATRPPEHKKPVYHVKWLRAALIKELIEGTMPYLIIKRERAEAMLDHIETLRLAPIL